MTRDEADYAVIHLQRAIDRLCQDWYAPYPEPDANQVMGEINKAIGFITASSAEPKLSFGWGAGALSKEALEILAEDDSSIYSDPGLRPGLNRTL